MNAEERFAKAIVTGPVPDYRPDLGPCVLYTGADNGNGYGQFRYNGKNGYAHRYAWERVNGPIPPDLTVDHLCRVRACVNTDHMELVDAVTNYRRGVASRTHCANGLHERTPENLYVTKTGVKCRPCTLASVHRSYDKRLARAVNGLPDRRLKFETATRDEIVQACVDGRCTVRAASEQLGCKPKYMDKLVRNARRAQGLPDRRQPRAPKAAS